MHPVQVVDGEIVVTDVAGRPQLHLTRALREAARVKPALRAWLDRAVATEPVSIVPNRADSALGRAVLALSRARHDFEAHRSARTAEQLLDSVALVLGATAPRRGSASTSTPRRCRRRPSTFARLPQRSGSPSRTRRPASAPTTPTPAVPLEELIKLALESRHRPDLASVNAVAIARAGGRVRAAARHQRTVRTSGPMRSRGRGPRPPSP